MKSREGAVTKYCNRSIDLYYKVCRFVVAISAGAICDRRSDECKRKCHKLRTLIIHRKIIVEIRKELNQFVVILI